MPRVLRVDFLDNPDNPINLLGSKAVGEPPFVLGISVGAAAKSALSSLSPGRSPPLSFPATSEEALETSVCARARRRSIGSRRQWRTNPVPEPSLNKNLMSLAIARARDGIAAGQSPFGAIIVRGADVVAATHNTVWRDTDPTAHAEVNCIRSAAAALKLIDLSGCEMYSTCEPCPMCLSAIHWSKIDRVVLRRDDRRRRDRRLLRAARRRQAPGRDGQEPAQGRERPASRRVRATVRALEEDRLVRDLLRSSLVHVRWEPARLVGGH